MPKILKTVFSAIAFLLIVGLSATTYYFYTNYQKAQKLVSNPQEISKLETAALVTKVSKMMDLPKEDPTVATVQEADKLKDQPFFANAVNGDKVLIFPQAKKAILYRPSLNRIIDTTPLYLNNSVAATPTPTEMAKPTPKTKTKVVDTKESTPAATPTE